MSEPILPTEPKPSLEPRDLNRQLRGLYDQLPPRWRPVNKADYAKELIKRMDTLSNSEHRNKIINKVSELLSKSSITPAFQRIMVDSFDNVYVDGKRTDEGLGQLVPSIDQRIIEATIGSDDSPGIFDPEIAKETELKVFKVMQRDFIGSVTRALDPPFLDEEGEGILFTEDDPEGTEYRKKIDTWQKEIVDRYGEEALSS